MTPPTGTRRPKVVLLHEIISPYRVRPFSLAAADGRIDLHVGFLGRTEHRRDWEIPQEGLDFPHTLLPSITLGRGLRVGDAFLNPTVWAFLHRQRPDLIVVGGWHQPTNWLALAYGRATGTPLALWNESTLRDARSGHGTMERLKRWFAARVQGAIVPGPDQAAYARHLGVPMKHIHEAPNAIDVDAFRAAAKEARDRRDAVRDELHVGDGPLVLTVGRLIDAKGIPELLRAFAEVGPQADATLVLAGDGPDRADHEALARALHLDEVRFLGFVDQARLHELLAAADLFVLPTLSDPWGLVLNEAMASGLPVIASDRAGATSTLVQPGVNGLIVDPRDHDVLAASLQDLLGDAERRAAMAAAASETATRFGPDHMAERFVTACAHLARGEPRTEPLGGRA